MPFFRRRAQRLGQNHERIELDGNLAGLGGEQFAARADEIAEVEVRENVPTARRGFFEMIFLRVNLEPAGLVAHVNEHGLAHFAVRGDAPGDGHFAAFGVICRAPACRFLWA